MAAVVVDTHAILWYITQDPRLSQKALDALEGTASAGDPIYVSAICLVELIYLIEKNRLPAAARERLIEALDDPERPPRLDGIHNLPFTIDQAMKTGRAPNSCRCLLSS